MAAGTPLPSAVLRALAGLPDGSGRTLVIAGPPFAGKSHLIEEIRSRAQAAGYSTTLLRGVYRERESAFGLVLPLEASAPGTPDEAASEEPTGSEGAGFEGMPYVASEDAAGRSRRGRGARQRGSVLGMAYTVRTRGVHEVDVAEWWRQFVDALREGAQQARVILVEEAIYADPESRDFLLHLVDRARLRPLLIVLALDTSDPGYSVWEEKLLGRVDVDWLRVAASREDPREASRFRRAWEELPESAQRAVALVALLGGTTSEVTLSRVSRRSFGELASDLLPAVESRVVRIEAGQISLRHLGWASVVPELWPSAGVREMHREIAEALEALHREPTLARRRELADHYFRWEAGPTALRYLLEAAEIADRVADYDAAAELTERGLACIGALPAPDRSAAEVELRAIHARSLFLSGRSEEGCAELADAVHRALERGVAAESVEEWLEPLVIPLLLTGARPSLETTLGELADRCEAVQYRGAAVLLSSVVAALEVERGRVARARQAARRAGHLARGIEAGPAQALALLAVAVSHLGGEPREREIAGRFLSAARRAFAASRRPDLQQLAEELRIEQLVLAGRPDEALRARQQSLPLLQRLRIPGIELFQQLGLAQLLLDTRPDRRVAKALERAAELIGHLHLSPPSPPLLRYWVLEARWLESVPDLDGARERLLAVADREPSGTPRPMLDEANLRLGELELRDGHEPSAQERFDLVSAEAFPNHRKPTFAEWADGVRLTQRLAQPSDGSTPGASA